MTIFEIQQKLWENIHFQQTNGESEEATFVHLHLAETEKIEFQLNGDGDNESWKFSIFKPKMEKISIFKPKMEKVKKPPINNHLTTKTN